MIPHRPEEDDDKYKQRGGKVNHRKYEADLDAWYKEVESQEKDHEPNQFGQMAYEAWETRRNKPENKAFYDEKDRLAREEAERQRLIREEKELSDATDSLRDMSGRLVNEIAEGMDDFGDDDHQIIASAGRRP